MHALSLLVPAGAVDSISDRLADECDALSVSVEDADAGSERELPVFDEPGVDPAIRWQRARVVALFADEAAAVAAAALLAADREAPGRVERIVQVDERDWVRETQSQFGPIEIDTGFWIVPSWSAAPAEASRLIRLDPGLAFGTGTHPTTRMCLRWIARHARDGNALGSRVLDYGSGSGVLAIAACVFGAADVEAVDIDPAAIETTRANASANRVSLRTGDVRSVSGHYGLIVANILATPLKMLAPLLADHLDKGGHLVLSGILERQAGELREAYAPWLVLDVADVDDGWILMTGVRPS